MADISQIKLPSGSVYNIKDATARTAIAALQAGGLTYQIVDSLAATPTKDDLGRIYLVAASTSGDKNIYNEYMCIQNNGTYSWELIGTTQIDLSGYAAKGDGVTASGSFTPSGTNESSSVTFSGSTQVYSMTSAGSVTAGSANVPTTPATIDTSKFSGGSYKQGTDSFTNGTLANWTATVSDEVLTIGWTAPTANSFTQGSDSFTAASLQDGFYTAGTKGSANTPTSVTLPSRGSVVNVLTTSTTATAAAQKFTGSSGTVNVSGTIDS